MKETVTVDPSKRVDAPRSVEEILREKAFSIGYCLKCKSLVQADKHHCPQCDTILHKEEADRTIYVYDAMALVRAQCVGRAQLKKLLKDDLENEAYIRICDYAKEVLERLK